MRKLLRKIRSNIHRLRYRHFDKFVFIHINKTGGSSIEKALKLPFEHKTAVQKIDEMGRVDWNSRFTFTVVRNPWDKVVSHYHYRVLTNQTSLGDNPISFNEWVLRTYGEQDSYYYDKPNMFMPQLDWIEDDSENILVNRVFRFENLDEEFSELMQILNKHAVLPHVKQSMRGGYREYYDKQSYQIIESWFKRDINKFGYKF